MPALVLLDVGLPGEDGFSVARWLREKSGRVCIIMVTAAGDTVDRVVGLETGADDYIPKPFDPRELLPATRACCVAPRAWWRRPPARACAWAAACSISRSGFWSKPTAARRRCRPANSISSRYSPRIPTGRSPRDWLLETIGHREMEVFDRAMDLRIPRIRRKIEKDPAHPEAIRTVRGVGYMFVPPKD